MLQKIYHKQGSERELLLDNDSEPVIFINKTLEGDLKMSTNPDAIQVYEANSLAARLLGLRGLSDIPWNQAILLKKPATLQTFGYRFPLDVIYLDADHCVIAIKHAGKNKMIPPAKGTASILQMKKGAAARHHIEPGTCLNLSPQRHYTPPIQSWRALFHWPVNILLAAIYVLFVYGAWKNWHATHNPISFGLVIVNSIIFYLFLTRRESKTTSAKALDWLIASATVLFAFLLQPDWTRSHVLAMVSTVMQILGMVLVALSLYSLGKSFGIVPANRQVKTKGAFQWVRHPLYASEITFYVGFLIGNFSGTNLILVLGIVMGQFLRARAEEALLSHDPTYAEYKRTVPYRFIPGIY